MLCHNIHLTSSLEGLAESFFLRGPCLGLDLQGFFSDGEWKGWGWSVVVGTLY